MRTVHGVCASCPGEETLELLLQNELDDMPTQYKQQTVTDRATLITVMQQPNESTENLMSKKPALTHHHYTARKQDKYMKESKEILQSDQCIILENLSET
jgi:hypothetical protein